MSDKIKDPVTQDQSSQDCTYPPRPVEPPPQRKSETRPANYHEETVAPRVGHKGEIRKGRIPYVDLDGLKPEQKKNGPQQIDGEGGSHCHVKG